MVKIKLILITIIICGCFCWQVAAIMETEAVSLPVCQIRRRIYKGQKI